jgi:hypothetical protein
MKGNSIWAACVMVSLVSANIATGAAPTFFARRDYPGVGSHVAVADTNGDGIPDVIEAAGGPGSVEVLFGNGNGTFRQGPRTNTGMEFSTSFAIADLNGDHKVDLILPGENQNNAWGISVSLGNGDGTFQPAVFYPAGTDTTTYYVALGDFNGDGITDAATVGASGIWLFTGKGGGAFNPGVLVPFNSGGPITSYVAAADFRKNGKLDLVVGTVTGFAVLLGNGNGTFQPQQNFPNPQQPGAACGFAVGAISSGGYPAIAANCGYLDQVPLYLGNGTGSFSGPIYVYMPGETVTAIADVNGDGIPDLVNSYGYVALGEGHAKFKAPVHYPIQTTASGTGPGNVVPAHLRSPSLVDLVAAGSGALSVLLNTGNKGFEDGRWTTLPSGAGCGAAADFNGDGKPDLAVNTSQGISVLLGTGSALSPFTPGTAIPLSGADCLVTADLNGDRIPDLLVPSAGAMNAYLGKGDGTFTLKSSTPLSASGYVAVADFNHDGKLDFATSSNLLALGNGDGTFQTPVPLVANPPLGLFTDLVAGDLNGDGWPDLVLTNWYYTSTIYILLNNQHGGFTQSTITACKEPFCYPSGIVLADVNGDGNLDLIVAEAESGGVVIYLGDGKGGFTEKQSLSDILMTPGPVVVADLNGDGIPDIGLMEAGTLGIFLGKGDGTFDAPFYIGAGPTPGGILAENLHGQPASAGHADLVAPDLSGGVMVLINTTK